MFRRAFSQGQRPIPTYHRQSRCSRAQSSRRPCPSRETRSLASVPSTRFQPRPHDLQRSALAKMLECLDRIIARRCDGILIFVRPCERPQLALHAQRWRESDRTPRVPDHNVASTPILLQPRLVNPRRVKHAVSPGAPRLILIPESLHPRLRVCQRALDALLGGSAQ